MGLNTSTLSPDISAHKALLSLGIEQQSGMLTGFVWLLADA